MPHAIPTWAYHGSLYNWMLNTKGSFWGGCRTGSGIENLFNPLNTTQQLNFLSNNVSTAGTALVPYTSHADGTPPYTHQFPSSPAAQYMGVTDAAHQSGSEQIYLPVLNGSWRSTTQIIAYDPSQQNVPSLSPGAASAIAFGRAFGNSNLGFVMYEAGHDISGTSSDEVAAQRAFFSFSFRVSVEKVPVISSVNVPSIFNSGVAQNISVAASLQNGQTLSYEWTSSCGGTFTNPASASTSFTAPIVTVISNCLITIKITDACGRNTFQTSQIKIFPPSTNPDFNSTFVNVAVPGNVNTNDNVPAGTTYGTSSALLSSPAGSTQTLTLNSNGTYSFTANTPGVYTYDVPVCVPGQVAPCPTTKLVITVLNANSNTNSPVVNADVATTNLNTAVTLRTLANDAAGNLGTSLVPSSVTVTSAPKNGITSVNTTTGDITYTPNTGFSGRDTLTYTVCDNQTPAKCATAIQIITVNVAGTPNSTTAADDYKITTVNTSATGNVKTNDSDAEGNTQTVTAQTTTIAGKGTLVLATDGSYTFTPVTGFTGPVDFVYTTCDNGSPQACASATLHILVSGTLAGPLAVKYLSLNAVPVENSTVAVTWVTSEEINNNHFEVERSFDLNSFKTIAIVLDGFAAGTQKRYAYTDKSIELQNKNIIYYRLKQYDNDGRFTYSKILSVKLKTDDLVAMQLSPNPFAENIKIRYNASQKGLAELSIIDANGKTILVQKASFNIGLNNISINGLSKLNVGFYVAKLTVNGLVTATEKIIKK